MMNQVRLELSRVENPLPLNTTNRETSSFGDKFKSCSLTLSNFLSWCAMVASFGIVDFLATVQEKIYDRQHLLRAPSMLPSPLLYPLAIMFNTTLLTKPATDERNKLCSYEITFWYLAVLFWRWGRVCISLSRGKDASSCRSNGRRQNKSWAVATTTKMDQKSWPQVTEKESVRQYNLPFN